MKHLYLKCLIFYLFFCFQSFLAQNNRTDSLENILDIDRLHVLIELARETSSISFEKSEQYVKQGLELARKKKDVRSEIELLLIWGDTYSFQGNFNKADGLYRQSYNLSRGHKLKEEVASSMMSIALNFYD